MWRRVDALSLPRLPIELLKRFRTLTLRRDMAPRKTRDRLKHDRKMLGKALRDCEAGGMDHLEPIEQASMIESIKQRIADLDARIEQLDAA